MEKYSRYGQVLTMSWQKFESRNKQAHSSENRREARVGSVVITAQLRNKSS